MRKSDVFKVVFLFVVSIIVTIFFYLVQETHINKIDFYIDLKDSSKPAPIINGVTNKNVLAHVVHPTYYKSYILVGDSSNVTSLYLSVNSGQKKEITIGEKTNLHQNGYKLPINLNKSRLPYFNRFINWGGDKHFFTKVFKGPLHWVVLVFCFVVLWIRNRFENSVNFYFSIQPNVPNSRFQILGWGIFITLFCVLFLIHPYYFLTEDVYAQFYPTIQFSLENWYNSGTMPTYNPLQLGGVPTVNQGIYSLFYPVLHFSFLLAKYVFGNNLFTININAFIHFTIAYYYLTKCLFALNVNRLIAIVSTLAFLFSGIVLMSVINWYYLLPTIAFLPILTWWQIKKWKTINHYYFSHAVLFVVYFYSGNTQYFLYTFCIWLSYLLYSKVFFSLKRFALLLLAVLVLALPQLLLSVQSLSNISRPIGYGDETYYRFIHTIAPFWAWIQSTIEPNIYESNNLLSYFNAGFFAPTLAFCTVLFFFFNLKKFKTLSKNFRFLILAIAVLILLYLGKSGLIWNLVIKLPVVKYFHHPIKFGVYMLYLSIIITAIVVSFLLNQLSNNKRKILLISYLSVSAIMIFMTVYFNQIRTFQFGDKQPYQKPSWVNVVSNEQGYRIMPVANATFVNFSASGLFNFPTIWGVPSISGWEEFNDKFPNLPAFRREFAVKYYVVPTIENYKAGRTSVIDTKPYDTIINRLKNIYMDKSVTVYEDSLAQTVLQINGNNTTSYTIEYKNNGAVFYLTKPIETNQQISLGFIYRKQLKVFADGIQMITKEDKFGRLSLISNQTIHKEIKIRYSVF